MVQPSPPSSDAAPSGHCPGYVYKARSACRTSRLLWHLGLPLCLCGWLSAPPEGGIVRICPSSADFTEHGDLEAHPRCCACQIPFHLEADGFPCGTHHASPIHSPSRWEPSPCTSHQYFPVKRCGPSDRSTGDSHTYFLGNDTLWAPG